MDIPGKDEEPPRKAMQEVQLWTNSESGQPEVPAV